MPELPEVENVRRNLQALVVGKTIASVDVRLGRLIRTPDDVARFCFELVGKTITEVKRRGKYLLFSVPPYTLISHLRMEGRFGVAHEKDEILPHTHVIFRFINGDELRYQDVRQFGTMDLVLTEADWPKGLRTLGPEPLDEHFTADDLFQAVSKRKAPIKAVLLDQTCIAGLGNIYVDESLFLANIHPGKRASSLTFDETLALWHAIQNILIRAINAGGSSIRSYVDGYGRHGGFQMELAVYGRDGQPCITCGSEIQKIRIAGRGTHYCPSCQPNEHVRESNTEDVRKGSHHI